jgi:site-specific DNA-methyltransferase (adenine-specific)
MKLSDIKPYEKNAKKHPKKHVEQVAASIKEFGMNQPIVVDKQGVIIVGHGRYEACKLLGIEPEIKVVELTEEQAKAYRLADNKLNESDWDMGLVIEELKTLSDEMFDLTGFDKDLIIEPDEKDDEVPEIPEEPKSKLGDLYELGQHRVLCGDSCDVGAVSGLMGNVKADIVVTDPPYNTGMEGKPEDEKARLSHMFNDKIENWEEFLHDVFSNYFIHTKGDCAFYCFIDWRRVNDIRSEMEKRMDVKNVIVWDKQVHGLGSDYKSTYELCVVGKKGKPEIRNRYGLDYQDIWRLQRTMGRNKDHATAKPVELLVKPITHASKQDDIVLDLFLGSGSTLIASEKTGRMCYGMELDPKYIDVIVQRYVDYTGNEDIIKNGKPIKWQKTPTKAATND